MRGKTHRGGTEWVCFYNQQYTSQVSCKDTYPQLFTILFCIFDRRCVLDTKKHKD